MVTLKEVCTHLEQLLQTPISDYCSNGLQVQGKPEIRTVCSAVSASLSTIKAAVEKKADVLIVHHGLFWNGDSYVITGSKREKIGLLLESNISLIGYHLPLDLHQELGNNWKAATDMGWKDLQPFCFSKGIAIGVQGRVPVSTREEFKQLLENYYEHPAQCAWGGKEQIQTAGLISGGAHKYIIEAVAAGLDCYVTGSFDEPTWNQAHEEKINFFALGHSATEKVGPKALGDHVGKRFGIPSHFLDTPNPF